MIKVNDQQFGQVTLKARQAAGGTREGDIIASWSLTFTARTDDLRDSPSLEVPKRLIADRATINAFDSADSGAKPGLPSAITVCARTNGVRLTPRIRSSGADAGISCRSCPG